MPVVHVSLMAVNVWQKVAAELTELHSGKEQAQKQQQRQLQHISDLEKNKKELICQLDTEKQG